MGADWLILLQFTFLRDTLYALHSTLRSFNPSIPRYTRRQSRTCSFPVIFSGTGAIPPASAVNYVPWTIVGFIFQYVIRRRHFSWWTKYNCASLFFFFAISTVRLTLIFDMSSFASRVCFLLRCVIRFGFEFGSDRDDGTSARYSCARSPCGASMSTVYCRLRARLTRLIAPELLPRRIPRTCRRAVRRARLGRCDLYYPHLLLVRVFFPFFLSGSPKYSTPRPPLLLLLRVPISSDITISLLQSHRSCLTPPSPISHLPSPIYISNPTRYLSTVYFLRAVPPSLSYSRISKNPHADKIFPLSSLPLSSPLSPIFRHAPYGLPLAPMCCYCYAYMVWCRTCGPVRFPCPWSIFTRLPYFGSILLVTATPDADADVNMSCQCECECECSVLFWANSIQ